MTQRRRISHHVWREALYDAPGETHEVSVASGDRHGTLAIAIAGDTYDETTAAGVVGTDTALTVDASFVGRGWHIERIVGDITYRGWAIPGVTSPGPGYTPVYTVRSGIIVLESDGTLGVPLVTLDDSNNADIEANWMFLEQFNVCGADLYTDGYADSDANLEGLNELIVTRHYDVRVGRRMNPHDLLVWRWHAWPGPYAAANEPFGTGGSLVSFCAAVRLLISR